MGNDGFDSSDETGYSSDDGYISCQRNGCGRSNPWGDLGCTYTHCCTLCSCWENGKWQIHSIECDADYIRECILRQPRKLGRTGRELMLLDIRDRGALSLRLCMKSEVDLLRVILFRTWVRTWRTSQLRYAQYIRNCKFKEYMRLGNSQWSMSPGSVFVPCRSCKVLGRIAALHGQSSGVWLCSSGALCGILSATRPIAMQP